MGTTAAARRPGRAAAAVVGSREGSGRTPPEDDRMHLVYFADPMCSWCWGFSPVIEAIRERYGESLPARLVMGGLRPGTRVPMDDASKASARSHWEHVHAASDQPFDFGFFGRKGFVYDTEPASRAVVLARRGGQARGFAYLRRVHAAFYAEDRDVTGLLGPVSL